MHYLVKLIVEADNGTEALEQAERDAQDLIECGQFDWYDLNGRWGDSKAYGVTSRIGRRLIKEGMDANREQFDSAMIAVRYMMEHYSDDDIYEENFGKWEDLKDTLPEKVYSLSRWQFGRVAGDSNSPCVYAVSGDLWGGKLEKEADLEHVLSKTNKKLWVVPVDFHN